MTDFAIPSMTAASTPLDGTELVHGVQSSNSRKVTTASIALLAVQTAGLSETGGTTITSKDLGTISSGTVTPVPSDRKLQHYTNNGAHTLAPGAVTGFYELDITNSASAGSITTSGWTKVKGDSFDTTNGHKFRCYASIGNAGSLLFVNAMQ